MSHELDDNVIIDKAMKNAYLVVTGKITFEDLLNADLNYLPYNPNQNTIEKSVYDVLIDYYCDIEEYEKCAEIKKAKEEKYPIE